MPDDKFKLPLSSYDELVKFIKAYAHVSEPADLTEISKLTGVSAPNISRNVGFFLATSILEGGKKKMPTSAGKQLGHALEHEMPDEIRRSWQQIVEETEFLTKLLTAVRIRNGMDAQTLEAHIAYSAGQPKKSQFMTGARTVIDILKAAELILESDGKYVLQQQGETRGTSDARIPDASPQEQQSTIEQAPRPIAEMTIVPPSSGGIKINVQININCTPDEVSGLGAKLKAMIADIASDDGTPEEA